MACKHVDDGRELHKAMPMPQGIQRIYVQGFWTTISTESMISPECMTNMSH